MPAFAHLRWAGILKYPEGNFGTSKPRKDNLSLVGSSIVDSTLGAEGVYKNGKPVSLYG